MRLEASILFDLDGTLTDPREGILGCFRHALRRMGSRVPPDEELEGLIGPPLREGLARLLGPAGAGRLEDAVAFYRERFTTTGMFENRVYPGIPEALAELRESGASLFLATSKPEPFAVRILDHFGLRRFFRGVHGSALDGARSQKIELIAYVLEREALPASNTAMVGDRAQDVLGAKANGVFSIGALWGYGSREELVSAGAQALCDRPSSLAGTVCGNHPFGPARDAAQAHGDRRDEGRRGEALSEEDAWRSKSVRRPPRSR